MPPKLAEIGAGSHCAWREVVLAMMPEICYAGTARTATMAAHECMEQVPKCQTGFFLR